MNTNTNIEQSLKTVLRTNPTVACWGLLRVYARQDEHEKTSGQATELNGEGFSKCDSEILTSLSQFLLERGFLTAKQMAIVHQSLPKYWRQVVERLNQVEQNSLLAGVVPVAPATIETEDQPSLQEVHQ